MNSVLENKLKQA